MNRIYFAKSSANVSYVHNHFYWANLPKEFVKTEKFHVKVFDAI